MIRIFTILFASLLVAIAPTNFYVSSAGSDANPGTLAAPWLTLTNSQTQVRTLLSSQSQEIIVTASNVVNSTLFLTAADSGKNGYHVTWSGELDAGNQVSNWVAWKTNGALVTYKTGYTNSIHPRSIYVNGVRGYMSSDNGTLTGGLTQTTNGYTGATGFLAAETNIGNVEFVYEAYSFSQARGVVKSCIGGTVTMLHNCHTVIISWPGALTNIVNLWGCFTNTPTGGWFYADTTNNSLYYTARTNENMATAIVIVPNGTATVVNATGATNINLNLTVQYAQWDLRTDGFASIAQCYYYSNSENTDTIIADGAIWQETVPAAIYIRGCTNVNCQAVTIQHCDTTGIHRTWASRACNVTDSVITDIGFNGLVLGDAREGTNSVCSQSCVTSNNVISACGMLADGACGIVAPFCANSSIVNNSIDSIPYCGIASGVGLDYHLDWQTNKVSGNEVSYNRITRTMSKRTDGGGIYHQAPSSSLRMVGNYVETTAAGAFPASGIYLDQGTMGVAGISNNVFSNVREGMFFNSIAGVNVVGINYSSAGFAHGGGSFPSSFVEPFVMNPDRYFPQIKDAAGSSLLASRRATSTALTINIGAINIVHQ